MLRRALPILLLLAIVLPGCATNPVSGKKEVALMSEEKEIAAGRQADPEIRKQYGVYDNAKLQAYVQRVGEKLAGLSHRPELFYRFTVLDSSEVNAFALPGGYVYITRGLMVYLNSEAELAAVLGHEIGHVTARHAVRQYTTAMAAQIGYTIGSIFVPQVGSQAGSTLFNVLGTALVRGYGRQYELQADQLGAEYSALAGYDPDAMLEVLQVLKNQEEFEVERAKLEGREPNVYHGVFATHPSNDERLQQVVKEAQPHEVRNPSTGRDEYLAQLDGIVFGDSVKQGVRYANKFYHKDLDLALRFPEGWRIENQPDRLVAGNAQNTARIVVRLQDLNLRIAPSEFMHQRLKLKDLKQAGELRGATFPSYTALTRLPWAFGTSLAHSVDTRVSVLYFRDKAYVFYGASSTQEEFTRDDPLYLDSARSLHALTDAERKLADGLRIKIITAGAATSFAELGKDSPIPNYPERMLRLINDRYPHGEPQAGSKIKVVR
jgi:predicted Zn-dependent protease